MCSNMGQILHMGPPTPNTWHVPTRRPALHMRVGGHGDASSTISRTTSAPAIQIVLVPMVLTGSFALLGARCSCVQRKLVVSRCLLRRHVGLPADNVVTAHSGRPARVLPHCRDGQAGGQRHACRVVRAASTSSANGAAPAVNGASKRLTCYIDALTQQAAPAILRSCSDLALQLSIKSVYAVDRYFCCTAVLIRVFFEAQFVGKVKCVFAQRWCT